MGFARRGVVRLASREIIFFRFGYAASGGVAAKS